MDFELPKGLKTIGASALQAIFYLTHLTIPAGVTDIEQMNFLMMHGLEESPWRRQYVLHLRRGKRAADDR